MYGKIIEGVRRAEQARQFEEQFKTPVLEDYVQLDPLFRIIDGEVLQGCEVRLVYTLIAVYLYSPRAFYGEYIMPKLAERIARQLKVNSTSTISRTFGTARFRFFEQAAFRERVERVYAKIAEQLQLRE